MNDQLDHINYTRPFAKQVQGRLYARFELGPDGAPVFEPDPSTAERRFYHIYLHLYSPVAWNIDTVTYYLLDPGFSDPRIDNEDEPNDFRAGIEASRDMPVDVTVNLMGALYKQRVLLSEMLENGHARNMTPAIRAAIDWLKNRG